MLPSELQDQIWHHTFLPRLVETRLSKYPHSAQHDFEIGEFPVSLHINKVARKEALRFYQLLFGSKQCRAPIYFYPKLDTLHIRDTYPSNEGLGGFTYLQIVRTINALEDKEKVTSLSVSTNFWDAVYTQNDLQPEPPILQFPNLEELGISFLINTAWNHLNLTTGHRSRQEHTGPCRNDGTAGSCFPTPEDTKATIGKNTLDTTYVDRRTQYIEDLIDEFVDDLEEGLFGDVEWKQPVFYVGPMCIKSIPEEEFACPKLCVAARKWKQREEDRKNNPPTRISSRLRKM